MAQISLAGNCLIVGSLLDGGHEGPIRQFSRILGATAGVTESVSELSLNVLSKTSLLTSRFFDATVSSLDAVSTLWRGVDLVNVRLFSRRGTVVADAKEVILAWLGSPAGQVWHNCSNEEVLEVWKSALASLSMQLPLVSLQQGVFETHGHFLSTRVHVSFKWTGHVLFQFQLTEVYFSPRWANPLWEAAAMDLDSETEQVQALLQRLMDNLPAVNDSQILLSAADVAASQPELLAFRWARYRNYMSMLASLLLNGFENGFWQGLGLLVCFWVAAGIIIVGVCGWKSLWEWGQCLWALTKWGAVFLWAKLRSVQWKQACCCCRRWSPFIFTS